MNAVRLSLRAVFDWVRANPGDELECEQYERSYIHAYIRVLSSEMSILGSADAMDISKFQFREPFQAFLVQTLLAQQIP